MSSKEIDPTAAVVGEWPTSLTSPGTATADYKDSSTLPKLQLFFLHLYLALLLSLSMPLFFSLILPLLLSVLPLQRKVEENCSNPCDGTSASSSGVTPATKNPVPEIPDQTDPPAPTSLTSPGNILVEHTRRETIAEGAVSSKRSYPAIVSSKRSYPAKTRKGNPEEVENIPDKVRQAGFKIREKYFPSPHIEHTGPLMLPPVPRQKIIDAFPEIDLAEDRIKRESEHQIQVEAEIAVYQALQKTDTHKMIVLAGLEYTHQQFQAFVRGHTCTINELPLPKGECDFVVILNNFILIFEVKSPIFDGKNHENKFSSNFEKSVEQRNKTRLLVEGILDITGTREAFTVMDYTVFPNLAQSEAECLTSYNDDYIMMITPDSDKEKILLKENIVEFAPWFHDKITHLVLPDSTTNAGTLKVSDYLIGLWCMDRANTCHTDMCSLTYYMDQIDENLTKSVITMNKRYPVKSKCRNSSVAETQPALFNQYLKIKFITTEQYKIFVEKQNCLLISGPAGTGKTVMILGKILDLVLEKSTQHKIVLVVFSSASHTHCEQVLRSAPGNIVSSRKVEARSYDEEVIRYIERELEASTWRVNILQVDKSSYCTTRLLAALLPVLADKHYHIFVDDCQEGAGLSTDRYYHAIPRVLAAPQPDGEPCTRWVACDLVQNVWAAGQSLFDVLNNIPVESVRTLSGVLRNTFEICRVLAVIRTHYISKCLTQYTISDTFIPAQQPGHYIHGPLPRLCVIQYQREEDVERGITRVVKEELEKLRYGNDQVDQNKIAIVASKWLSEIRRAVDTDNITVLDTDYIASAEWQAVIGVVDYTSMWTWSLTYWYRAVSRAKVYCSLIVAVNAEDYRDIELVINKLEPLVIMRHVIIRE